MAKSALICLNLINEFLDPKGKLSKDYAEFAKKHDTLKGIRRLQEHFREQGQLVIHSRLCFSSDYWEHPGEDSVLFGPVLEKQALKLDEWGTEFVEETAPQGKEPVLNQHRISAFYRTRLDIILRAQGIENLFIVGLGLNMSVENTAREAHDADYHVTIVDDACIAHTQKMHDASLESLKEFAVMRNTSDILLKLVMGNR
jgi:nicotinamidase-related amidase